MAQLVTRLDDRLVEQIDALVAAGVVANRSEAVRVGLMSVSSGTGPTVLA
jgi:Arc/MetJ-type ribon-helix-helix transcriptional regulator